MKRILLPLLCMVLVSCSPAAPVVAPPAAIPPELTVAEYPLQQQPEAEYTLLFFADSVTGDPRLVHASERANTFDWSTRSCPADVQNAMAMCAILDGDQLVASENYNQTGTQGWVTLTRAGKQIYKISIGEGSPINALRGLWIYDDHWALEIAEVTNLTSGNTVSSKAVGQVTVDGVLLNDKYGYEEAFGFQTLHGKPFYFFKRDGKIHASYDGVDIPLSYQEIPHYGCCSASTLNPSMFQNMVAFFARRGGTWYYAEIGVFGQP